MTIAHDIATLVCVDYRISENSFYSDRRAVKYALPRQVAYYITHHLTKLTYPQIGRAFNRDHTSVMHGVKKIDERAAVDSDFRYRVARLMDKVQYPVCEREAQGHFVL